MRMPGRRLSSNQRVAALPGWALTVSETPSGREGDEEIV
jgi:hypothetical protein